jgi:hypothetical protein
VRRALALLALLAAAAATGCCKGGAARTYVIDAPDPDLMEMLQTCVDAEPCIDEKGFTCVPPQCRLACLRVVTTAGDSPEGLLKACAVTLAMDGGTGARVYVSFDGCGY